MSGVPPAMTPLSHLRTGVADALPNPGQSVIFYSQNTGIHRGYFESESGWMDIYGARIDRVSWWLRAWSEPAAVSVWEAAHV